MADKAQLEALKKRVYEHRVNIVRLAEKQGKMHLGGDMSCAEVLVTLFHHTMRIDPKNPHWADRDRFILSKGHCGGAMYLAMASVGYFPMEEVFETYKGYETRFGTHPCKAACDELDTSSGSLGHGMPISVGLALAAKMDKRDYRVFCMVGDGELAEGSNWEAAMAAARLKLGNLIVLVDRNYLSLDGPTEDILPLEPLADKWRTFNWNIISIPDGNDLAQVVAALDKLPPADSGVPTVVIANTVKGKGISFMENNALFHNNAFSGDQLRQALDELDKQYGA